MYVAYGGKAGRYDCEGALRYGARNENFVRVWVAQDDHHAVVQGRWDIKGEALG